MREYLEPAARFNAAGLRLSGRSVAYARYIASAAVAYRFSPGEIQPRDSSREAAAARRAGWLAGWASLFAT